MTSSSAALGASVVEWQHFANHLDLTVDLLPVVSNPRAVISPKSKMKDLGKTPSRYNREREAVGIPEWTSARTTDVDVARWQRDNDLGICLQTRQVRAIDIDIADPALARRIRDCVEVMAGPLPVRSRPNSSKLLLAFRLEGSYTKRILRTEQGIVEFLAGGQQFVAVGTHPSGVKYEWEGGLPAEIPYLTGDEFEAIWAGLAAEFAVSASVQRAPGARPTVARTGEGVDDAILTFLERTGWVKDIDSQGRAHITCPWAHEHSDGGEGSESATSYFPKGVGGFEQGHFRCLHAHCDGRTDGDFLGAVGYNTEGFEVLAEPQPGDPSAPLLLPAFERDRSGNILATVGNLEKALRRADVCGVHVGYDSFRDELMAAARGTDDWRQFTDADYVRVRIRLEAGGFKPIGRELVRDVVGLVAQDKQFDSAQLWLGQRAWDGVPRVQRFWTTYFGVEDTAYIRACGVYTWTAMAGRVLQPGVQADMAIILVGAQGVGKTTGVKAMVPAPEHFLGVRFDSDETEMARRMRGKLIGEIGELRGLHSREIEHIKEFISRTDEEWVPKFKEFSTKFPRRLIFIGTTNNDEFLADETGERRWLPMRVGDVDRDAIARDRDQLWAEAALLFAQGGVCFGEAQALAKDVHHEYTISDAWDGAVEAWLEGEAFEREGKNGHGRFTAAEVLVGALGMSTQNITKSHEMRMARVLKRLGCGPTRVYQNGRRVRVWTRVDASDLL